MRRERGKLATIPLSCGKSEENVTLARNICKHANLLNLFPYISSHALIIEKIHSLRLLRAPFMSSLFEVRLTCLT